MQYLKILLLIIYLFSFSTHGKKIEANFLMTGVWNCSMNILLEEEGVKILMELEETFVRNGRSNSFGMMNVKWAEEMPNMEYYFSASGIWNIKDKYLIEQLTDINIKNISHPEFDEIFDFESFFPKNLSASSEIIELSDSKFTLKDEADGRIYRCYKKSLPNGLL